MSRRSASVFSALDVSARAGELKDRCIQDMDSERFNCLQIGGNSGRKPLGELAHTCIFEERTITQSNSERIDEILCDSPACARFCHICQLRPDPHPC